ncbi:MAG: hypothetical protein HN736_13475 [Anaerolineae bacterium]|jgi:hypothetical protein|nr:hypothetical protein [Anaerolineae bacterium]MBT3714269.1 hypothetical protein [Anaerolineae bacterium]MBT4311186.1 hypothetical protein [Anaerolineae bacterium]MBT4458407.1 hypothetical protein [Anaerolineae bacterium]MBT4843759.1 hypothetical protein [Anaerolineae bacterium]
MLKRAIFWLLYLLFVVGLIWGAINRTSSVLEENDRSSGSNHTREINQTAEIEATPSEDHSDREVIVRWEILKAEISVLSNRDATMILENGEILSLNPRSWRFAQAQGLQAQLGDSLLLTGFFENEKFEVVHLRNLDNGTVAQIRDEAGHPLWVSGGNGE